MTDDITPARWWRKKRQVGPHVVEPTHSPVTLHSQAFGVHEKFSHQWECKYCGEKHPLLEGFAHVPSDCDGIEWLDSEVEGVKSR